MKTIKLINGIALALACGLVSNLKAQNLYVLNSGNGTIGEYTTSGATVNASLISGLGNTAEGIAISGNDLFVLSENGTIGEYTTSGATITGSLITGLDEPGSMAVSGTNLFVTYYTGNSYYYAVGEYTTSGQTVNASLISGLDDPTYIATSGNELFIGIWSATIDEASSGGGFAFPLISGLDEPESMAISGTNLFVVNEGSSTIGEYTTFGGTITASMISGLSHPDGIAISGNDLFVANALSGTIGEYTTSGATVNTNLISGLNGPNSIAIGPASPPLNIATVGSQSVLYYPTWATNYVLQSTTNLAAPDWINVTNCVPVIAVTVTNQSPAQFFRLIEQ